MTKENAKGLTLAVRAKLQEIHNTLCNVGLVDTQIDDLDCNVELMSDAVIHLAQAISDLSRAYRNIK